MGGNVGKEPFALLERFSSAGMLNCTMVGLDSSGKTTVLYRMKFGQYVNAAPTIGFNCERVKLNGKSFTVWDVGGQDKLRPLWRSYTRCTDAIIFVVDSCNEERLDEAKLELTNVYRSCHPKSDGAVPLLVLANKQDLPGAVEASRLEQVLGLKDLKAISWHVQSTCAVTGEGLDEGMAKLHEMIIQRRKKHGRQGQARSKNHQKSPP